jgi:hypothetical protein
VAHLWVRSQGAVGFAPEDGFRVGGGFDPVGFCSPERILQAPDLSWLLLILIPLQLLLAVSLVRSKQPLRGQMPRLRAGAVEAFLRAGAGSWKRRLARRTRDENG